MLGRFWPNVTNIGLSRGRPHQAHPGTCPPRPHLGESRLSHGVSAKLSQDLWLHVFDFAVVRYQVLGAAAGEFGDVRLNGLRAPELTLGGRF